VIISEPNFVAVESGPPVLRLADALRVVILAGIFICASWILASAALGAPASGTTPCVAPLLDAPIDPDIAPVESGTVRRIWPDARTDRATHVRPTATSP